jgi:hypothetical protein
MSDAVDAEQAAADLYASSPEAVASALAALERASLRRPVRPVPMPSADILDIFGDSPPEEIVTRFVAVVLGYPLFDPPVDTADRMEVALQAALRFGPGQPAYDLARFVRANDDPVTAVDELMRLILEADVEDPAGLDAVGQIVDVLLDAKRTHDAVVRGLGRWAFRGRYPGVIEELGNALSEAERDRIRGAGT